MTLIGGRAGDLVRDIDLGTPLPRDEPVDYAGRHHIRAVLPGITPGRGGKNRKFFAYLRVVQRCCLEQSAKHIPCRERAARRARSCGDSLTHSRRDEQRHRAELLELGTVRGLEVRTVTATQKRAAWYEAT